MSNITDVRKVIHITWRSHPRAIRERDGKKWEERVELYLELYVG